MKRQTRAGSVLSDGPYRVPLTLPPIRLGDKSLETHEIYYHVLADYVTSWILFERDHWEDQDVGGWTISKWILER
jgi:hypothetical protein